MLRDVRLRIGVHEVGDCIGHRSGFSVTVRIGCQRNGLDDRIERRLHRDTLRVGLVTSGEVSSVKEPAVNTASDCEGRNRGVTLDSDSRAKLVFEVGNDRARFGTLGTDRRSGVKRRPRHD